MTTTTATPQEHSSLVGGSTAARRIGCPASYQLERKVPRSQGSVYAREGTALHEMAALVLEKGYDPEDMLPFTHKQPAKGVEDPWELTIDHDVYADNLEPALQMFDDFLDQIEAEADADAVMLIEQSGEFPSIAGAFGTSDVVFKCGNIAGVWDWKFGRKHVAAYENKQLMFYACAMRQKHPKFFEGTDKLILCISQPKCNDSEPETWETTHDRLDEFIIELEAAVKETQMPDPRMEKGEWCTFADCKAICPLHVHSAVKLGEKMRELGVAKHNNEVMNTPDELDQFLAEAMELAEMAEAWAKQIAGMVHERIDAGFTVEGWKTVDKKSSGRVWTVDEGTVISRLKSRGLKAGDYYNKTVVTPPQAEKALKKLGKTLPDDCVAMKSSSGTTLTREGDPRSAKVSAHETASKVMQKMKAIHNGK